VQQAPPEQLELNSELVDSLELEVQRIGGLNGNILHIEEGSMPALQQVKDCRRRIAPLGLPTT
jgi:hypothetical protein